MATATSPLRRIGREMHYPPNVVDVQDPFILLVHQGMVEEVFIDDLQVRGVEVIRSCQFVRHKTASIPKNPDFAVEVECDDLKIGGTRNLRGRYLVGCDGAHSRVRKSMLGA